MLAINTVGLLPVFNVDLRTKSMPREAFNVLILPSELCFSFTPGFPLKSPITPAIKHQL